MPKKQTASIPLAVLPIQPNKKGWKQSTPKEARVFRYLVQTLDLKIHNHLSNVVRAPKVEEFLPGARKPSPLFILTKEQLDELSTSDEWKDFYHPFEQKTEYGPLYAYVSPQELEARNTARSNRALTKETLQGKASHAHQP